MFLITLGSAARAQVQRGLPEPSPSPTPKLSELLSKNLQSYQPGSGVSRERREQAYAKLLEGQRYVWSSGRLRSQAGVASTSRLARQAFQKAVELDPTLAEGYTALAELAINIQPGDLEEAIGLAAIATRFEPNNFGAHRILARLYTYKSGLNGKTFEPQFATKAIDEWKQVVSLDSRNAEAWAFLSAFYEKSGQNEERIDSLKKWLASAPPIETQFYRKYMAADDGLSPESAALKLGPALIKAGRVGEAIETLGTLIADDPDNFAAVELLREAVQASDGTSAAAAVSALQQAVYANPGNLTLVNLLAQVSERSGKIDDAVKLLRTSAARIASSDRSSGMSLQVSVGDIFTRAGRTAEAVAAYDEALKLAGMGTKPNSEDEKEQVTQVFEKIIQALKSGNRQSEVPAVIERARKLLGNDDLFADRQLISYYREAGKRPEALEAVKAARIRSPQDYGLLRLHATLLTELGHVDEGVALIRALMTPEKAAATTGPLLENGSTVIAVVNYDDFSNYLFIANLFSDAKRPKEAAEAANKAYLVAKGSERKQIAKLTLATLQQSSGDFGGAEGTLRAILKESPGNPIAMNNLGYFLLERNERLQEAFDLIQQAAKIDPINPSYLDSLGWAYFKLGRLAEAEVTLKDASRYDPGSATILEHLGDVYQQQGRFDMARTSWERALNVVSDLTDANRLREKLKKHAK